MVFPFAPPSSGEFDVFVGAGILRGWAFFQSDGAGPAFLTIYDGPEAAGQVIAPISLVADESTRDYPPGNGIMVRTSLTIVTSGEDSTGSLWFTPLTHAADVEWAFGERGPYFARPGA